MNMVTPEKKENLIHAAQEARESAYAPYSHFKVGAAILAGSGEIYQGCNVENASLGLTICAERNALAHAVVCREQSFSAISIVTDAPHPTSPCGACRQVLSEFSPELIVIMQTTGGEELILSLDKLLPHRFGP